MSLWEKLKWMWDPRTEEEKAYAEWNRVTPLQKRSVTLYISIAGKSASLEMRYTLKDEYLGDDIVRWATDDSLFRSRLKDYLQDIPEKGLMVGNYWYSPKMISKVFVGEKELTPL